jgi:hypothetical protein
MFFSLFSDVYFAGDAYHQKPKDKELNKSFLDSIGAET